LILKRPKGQKYFYGHFHSSLALLNSGACRKKNIGHTIQGRKELLTAINDFLDSSVVLPPGDWDSKNLLSMDEINELRNRKRGRKSKDMSTSSVSEGTVYRLGQKTLTANIFESGPMPTP
jgi:hypothetical protein